MCGCQDKNILAICALCLVFRNAYSWSSSVICYRFHQKNSFVYTYQNPCGQFRFAFHFDKEKKRCVDKQLYTTHQGNTIIELGDDSTEIFEKTNKNNIMNSKNETTTTSKICNFRSVTGFECIPMFRCAKTDDLADLFQQQSEMTNNEQLAIKSNTNHVGEQCLLWNAGLIIDLRSPIEINEIKATLWMKNIQSKGSIEIVKTEDELLDNIDSGIRSLLRLDILQYESFLNYVENNWFTTSQKIQAKLFHIIDGNALHHLFIDSLNKHGLLGLNEVIIEIGKNHLLTALKAITLFIESKITNHNNQLNNNDNAAIVFHCVQGKDRTGILAMLLQSMIGISDDIIINEYHLSESLISDQQLLRDTSSAAAVASVADNNEKEYDDGTKNKPSTSNNNRSTGRLDKKLFVGAPKQVMIDTLIYIRNKYGSVSPGYLNHIGFHEEWQIRLRNAVSVCSRNLSSTSSSTIRVDSVASNQTSNLDMIDAMKNMTRTSKY